MDYIISHQVKTDKEVWCPDGIASAWVASLKYPSASVLGCSYQSELPQFPPGCKVLVVDFSFPLEVLLKWQQQGIKIIVVDHHKTAQQDLANFSNAIFDTNECGATLLWKTLFPKNTMPVFLGHIRDRDLWIKTPNSPWWGFSLPETAAYHEAMSSLGRSFELFNKIADMNEAQLRDFLYPLGQPLLEKKISQVEAIANRAQINKTFCGMGEDIFGVSPVAYLRLTPEEDRMVSDIGGCLVQRHSQIEFAAMQTSDGNWELRSYKFGANHDVGYLARKLGGGGHRNASGFKDCPEVKIV